jgi:dTDP-4-dehydrorhamnose 3,5-epimerase
MSRFHLIETPLAGLTLIERQPLGDTRGFFERVFCAEELAQAGWVKPVVQINRTVTRARGTVRGMHFQLPPHAEMKLVSCLRGAIWDVAVDLRAGSPTFLQWHAVELSGDNHRSLLIPEGFAHGFQTLSDDCELLYLHSTSYASDAERGLPPEDPALDIGWPLPIAELSARDKQHPQITSEFTGLML